MRAKKVHYKRKDRKITSCAREPGEMCRGEMKSSLGVVKFGILRLRLSRGLDARGCRLLRRRSVMTWWGRGSYTTTSSLKLFYTIHIISKPKLNSFLVVLPLSLLYCLPITNSPRESKVSPLPSFFFYYPYWAAAATFLGHC